MSPAASPSPATERPLAGRTVVVTRPADQSRAIVASLRRMGARPIVAPAIEIVPVRSAALTRALDHALVVFLTQSLALLLGPFAAHLLTVLTALLLAHELAAVDALRLALRASVLRHGRKCDSHDQGQQEPGCAA